MYFIKIVLFWVAFFGLIFTVGSTFGTEWGIITAVGLAALGGLLIREWERRERLLVEMSEMLERRVRADAKREGGQ